MARQRSMGSGATATKCLLSRTVATVTIVNRGYAGAHAGETSGAMRTVATVCGSSSTNGDHVVAHVRVCRGHRAIGDHRPNPPPVPPVGHTSRLPKWHVGQAATVPSRPESSGEARGNSHHWQHSLFCLSELLPRQDRVCMNPMD